MRSFIQNLPPSISNTILMVRRLFGGFYEDGLFTITNSDFRRSEHFKHVYAAAKATGSFGKWNLRWRIHILCWAANHAAALDGDFVECGVDHGGTAMAAIVHTDFGKLGKNFWLLDTFKGLDRSQLTASEASTTGFLDYPDCFERVRANFAEMDFVRLVRGSVPSTLNQVTCENVAYLHLDMNCTAPEVAALEHFWPKLSPFGIVIMDDYGWPRCHEQKVGYDRFARDRDLQILQIPTGQGILVKPPS